MGLKLPVRPKFFLGYLFLGHEFSQEKVLKRSRSYRDRREKWRTTLAWIKNISLKRWQNLLCLCYSAWNWDPLASVARWTQLGQAETQNKHFLDTRMVMGNSWLYLHSGSNHGPIYLQPSMMYACTIAKLSNIPSYCWVQIMGSAFVLLHAPALKESLCNGKWPAVCISFPPQNEFCISPNDTH